MTPMDVTKTVLLVEDQEQLRSLVRRILERHRYRVFAAESASVALEILGAHAEAIDIVLTDVIMPETSGLTLAHQVREQYPSVKIILMSGLGLEMLMLPSTPSQPDAVLAKPFTIETLLQAVRKAA